MLNLSQTQKQTLRISPSQIQLLNFLQLSTLELEEHIKTELEENPLLEEAPANDDIAEADDFDRDEKDLMQGSNSDYLDWDEYDDDTPNYKTQLNNYSSDDDFYSAPIVQQISWREDLKEQLHVLALNERQLLLGDFIIDSLDEHGFLKYDAEAIADDVSFTNNIFVDVPDVEEMIKVIRQLDPIGIGASNLQECLLLQLDYKREQGYDVDLAYEIVLNNLDDLAVRNYEKIMRSREICTEKLKEAMSLITSLNAKPVSEENTSSILVKDNIIPDYLVFFEDNKIEVSLNSNQIPPLKVNNSFQDLLQGNTDKAATHYIHTKVSAANWLIDAIQQRETTMLKTMRTLVKLQEEFFKTGNVQKLKPMTLKDVAEIISMDISTVSRVTSGKYAQTPFGTIHLKDLFSGGIFTDSGTEVSNREIQQTLATLISNEDKNTPLNDFQLADLLAQKGYPIARRTVAKYRDHLGIQSAQLRRVL
ncbi:RNA polymerase factor sigma-54 [Emticicia sp. BO119]|uniref:RNA polymerase factor sigma-54 n=1 Tax=Emticicia sp. BO119 TaxID=2757768 RepID=UPI0015F091BC|nr:RNA polymerase factor sigma-54 [Emticicia sp. BO119]MBA4854002.1 RNA polymerase factor sigma-54 [Emticicia sp. BO119]